MKTPAQLLQPLYRFARRLYCNQRGAVAPLFLVSSGLVFGTGLGSIDLMRYTSVKAHLQAALDNAALAAGKLASLDGMDAPLLAEAQGYFQANFPSNYLGSTIDVAGLSLQTDGSTLTLDISGGLPLLSTGYLDISAFGLQTSATVALDGKGPSEVVFALDRGNPILSAGSGYPGNSGSSGNSKGWKGCENGGGHPNCNNTGTDGDPVIWAAGTLADLLLPEESRGSGVHVGLVPFSEVVNVGAAGKPWVAEWLQEWGGNPRTQYANANYTENVWRGCIAEPQPWNPPGAANALSPDARFQPVLTRVPLELYDGNDNSGQGLILNGKDKKQDLDADAYTSGQIVEMQAPTSPQYDRRLWAEYSEYVGTGKSSKGGFYAVGAFENAQCKSANQTRFLSNDRPDITNALTQLENQGTGGVALTPAGLLWSWRMIHPNWRNHADGWNLPQSLSGPEENKQKAIVLFSANPETLWGDVDDPAYAKPESLDGEFAFELDYKVVSCSNNGNNAVCDYETVTHTQTHVDPKEMKVKDEDAPEIQYPATSLLMADPFNRDSTNPASTGWPTVNNYTREVCDAIKADGIEIYVVDVNDTGSSVLSHCSSDGILYSLDRVPELRNVIQVTQTSGEKLRLIR